MWRDSTNLLFGIMRNLNTSESLDLLVPWDSFSCLRYRKSAFLFLSPFWGESSSGCCAAGLDSSLFPPGSPTHSPLLSLFHHTCSFDILFWSSGLCNMLFIYIFFSYVSSSFYVRSPLIIWMLWTIQTKTGKGASNGWMMPDDLCIVLDEGRGQLVVMPLLLAMAST